MRLPDDDCWALLATARHGVLATLHHRRGADLVPVVFAVVDRTVVVPLDTVKAKAGPPGSRLQRQRNLDADPRCTLLADHYVDDWNRLWWVRLHAVAASSGRPPSPAAIDTLAARYPSYRSPGAVPEVLVLSPTAITGWRAAER